ncbi:MAG: adenylate/guanylate cyclase domain-containing protein [Cyanobacteria bacterium P01_F01_bin.150]
MFSKLSISIRTKILAIATSMLGLLVGTAAYNYSRIHLVNYELIDIAVYLTPLTEYVAEVNVHALEQEIHFERMVRAYESVGPEPLDSAYIEAELAKFEERGHWVDEEIQAAIALTQTALANTHTVQNQVEFAQFLPLLTVLEEDHARLHDSSVKILEVLNTETEGRPNTQSTGLLYEQLVTYEDTFNRRIEELLLELGQYTEIAALDAEAHEKETLKKSWQIVGLASAVGVVLTSLVTVSLVRPVRQLVTSSQSVEQGELDVTLSILSNDEIGTLTASFNAMVADIREKERLKATFGQYVDPRIVETLVQEQAKGDPQEGIQQGQKQVMTVFFSDIAGFSTISELLTPSGLVTVINEYLTLASAPIKEHQGVINQFIGDAVSAFWGPPFVGETEHALWACYAAMEQFNQLAKLQRLLPDIMGIRKGLPQIAIRIGLATGEVVSGNIGSDKSKSYTVIGPTVQLAEHLEGANKQYGTQILMAEATYKLVQDNIVCREINQIVVPGHDQPIRIYEPLGYVGTVSDQQLELGDRFQSGLNAYRNQEWQVATKLFEHCLHLQPNDGPSCYFLRAIKHTSK